MLSSSAIALDIGHGHRYESDGHGEMRMERPTKKQNFRTTGGSEHPTNMEFEFLHSKSPLVISSPSGSTRSSIKDLDDDQDDHVDVNDQIEKRLPPRVSMMNVVRPIPKRISTQYYEQAHREGLTLNETNQAAMMAHDWHRKWTYQDEQNHTMPDKDFYEPTAAGLPVSYAYDKFGTDIRPADDYLICLEREEGAKNPSLGSSPEDPRVIIRPSPSIPSISKRHYTTTKKHNKAYNHQDPLKEPQPNNDQTKPLVVSSTEASTRTDSGSDDDLSSDHRAKRQFTGSSATPVVIEDDDDYTYESYQEDDKEKSTAIIQRPLPLRPTAIKPVALRPNRPGFSFPQPSNERLSPFIQTGRNEKIPRDILTHMFNGPQIVSPMSYSHLTGSSSMTPRSFSGNEMIGMTVLGTDQEEVHLIEDDSVDSDSISTANSIVKGRDDILHTLAISDGDVDSNDFKSKVDPLEKYFLGKHLDTRSLSRHVPIDVLETSVSNASVSNSIEGMWLTLSKPNWFGKLGHNDNGDPMYTMGRMSFDMFSPTNLICSIQGNFNHIEIVGEEDRKAMLHLVPKKLREEVESGKTVLRTYHVVTAFTIEPSMAAFPNAPNKDVMRPIRGIMTTYGYSLPDPDTPNRHSIWFTGGRIEPNNDVSDIKLWKDFFKLHPPKHSFGEKAKLLAVKLLMGATIPQEIDPDDGSMNYVFTRPLGGHGMAYVDTVYMDESLRIMRGHRGTTFVFSRVPDV